MPRFASCLPSMSMTAFKLPLVATYYLEPFFVSQPFDTRWGAFEIISICDLLDDKLLDIIHFSLVVGAFNIKTKCLPYILLYSINIG
jgi:hypothetical protein